MEFRVSRALLLEGGFALGLLLGASCKQGLALEVLVVQVVHGGMGRVCVLEVYEAKALGVALVVLRPCHERMS